jgi:phage gp45-like
MSLINRVIQRIEMMLVKALVERVVDSDEIQLVKISGLAGETMEGIERLQNYGLSSSPPAGEAEALVGFLNGNRDHGVVIVCDSGAYRVLNLKDGEVALYSKHGQTVLLTEDGDVEADLPGVWSMGTGADFVAMAAKVNNILSSFYTMFSSWTPAPQDGGAALKTLFTANFPSPPEDVSSTNLKADG